MQLDACPYLENFLVLTIENKVYGKTFNMGEKGSYDYVM
jgi:hypothetical protein